MNACANRGNEHAVRPDCKSHTKTCQARDTNPLVPKPKNASAPADRIQSGARTEAARPQGWENIDPGKLCLNCAVLRGALFGEFIAKLCNPKLHLTLGRFWHDVDEFGPIARRQQCTPYDSLKSLAMPVCYASIDSIDSLDSLRPRNQAESKESKTWNRKKSWHHHQCLPCFVMMRV